MSRHAGAPRRTCPRASVRFDSPYDPEAHYGNKHPQSWLGYKVHFSETCGEDEAHLITHVETTSATLPDIVMTGVVHQALSVKGLLPSEHLVDAGYVSADHLVSSGRDHGVDLIGPRRDNVAWQARAASGYDFSSFNINWEAEAHGRVADQRADARRSSGGRPFMPAAPAARGPRLPWYGPVSATEREMELSSDTALRYHAGKPPVAIRWVLLRDPAGRLAPQALLSTDADMEAGQNVAAFVRRRSMETTEPVSLLVLPQVVWKSGSEEHAAAQQVEARTTIHLTLEHLEAVDLPFSLSTAPGQGQSGTHRRPVLSQPGGEGLKRLYPAADRPLQPVREAGHGGRGRRPGAKVAAAGAHEGRKLAQQVGHAAHLRVALHPRDDGGLRVGAPDGGLQEQPGKLLGRG